MGKKKYFLNIWNSRGSLRVKHFRAYIAINNEQISSFIRSNLYHAMNETAEVSRISKYSVENCLC